MTSRSLRTGIMAGSPCPAEVMKRVIAEMHMEQVTICYGMTETSPVSTQTGSDDELERRVGTVGRVHPHVEVKIVDPLTGRTVSRGEPGELCTRGYSVMLGYWGEPEQTAEAIDRAGWMHTGDLATMDDAGYVRIVGRSKDMIIRGGENIYPREIEEFLLRPPGRRRRAGRRRSPTSATARRSSPSCAARPARSSTRTRCASTAASASPTTRSPATSHFVAEFPMTVTGKVQKFKLREQAIAELRGQ